MFHIDFESEKSKSLINWSKYAVTAIVVAVVTIILVFAATGYDIDRETGEIIQNGLVITASQPVSADVFINGVDEDDPTSSKFSLPAGQYTFELKRDGYHDWVKKVSIEGSEVIWLQYPRLIPTEIKMSNYHAFKNVNLASQSPDRKYALVHEAESADSFSLVSLESTTQDPEPVTLPATVLNTSAGQKSAFEVLDWAQDNRTIVIKHTNGPTTEMILFDVTKPEEAINLTELYELGLTDIRFVDSSNSKLYTIVNTSLRVADVGAQNITASLVDQVAQYEPKDGIVAVLHGPEDKVKVSVLDGNELFTVTDLTESSDKYQIATSVFDSERYLAISDNQQERVFLYEDFIGTAKSGEGPKLVDSLRLANTEFLSISPNGQFVVAQSGKSFRVYDFDIDAKRAFNTALQLAPKTAAEWIDSHHLSIVDKDGQAAFVDYDGLNSHTLVKLDASLGPMYMHNTEGLYFFATDGGGSDILKFSSLIAE